MGAFPSGVDDVSQVGGRGRDDTGNRHSLPGELFISPRSTRERHYGWLAATNKGVKGFQHMGYNGSEAEWRAQGGECAGGGKEMTRVGRKKSRIVVLGEVPFTCTSFQTDFIDAVAD